jgi:hypothetical protein
MTMSKSLSVLGIDLASRSWQDNGTALLTFERSETARFTKVAVNCLEWPDAPLSAEQLAGAIDSFVRKNGVVAVSIDGPQGWREPNAGDRKGVGRLCEFEARCQGKTGELGKTYPQTQHDWIKFAIDLFATLLANSNARVANDCEQTKLEPLGEDGYWVIECFPTLTWRTLGLRPLPGKQKVGRDRSLISDYARRLATRCEIPECDAWEGSHDDLQAVVAALPAASLLGGPGNAKPYGKAGYLTEGQDGLWVEGIIWSVEFAPSVNALQPETLPTPCLFAEELIEQAQSNPLLIDDRDDYSSNLLERGCKLFRYLAELANRGESVGVSYAQFITIVHRVESFRDVANRNYAQSDTSNVLGFAAQVTLESGGPIDVKRGDVTIQASMDAFIWSKSNGHDRPIAAFTSMPYSRDSWKAIFPDGQRRLIRRADLELIFPEDLQ